jgi:hypothetical protein
MKKVSPFTHTIIKKEPVFWMGYGGKSIPGIELEPSMAYIRNIYPHLY